MRPTTYALLAVGLLFIGLSTGVTATALKVTMDGQNQARTPAVEAQEKALEAILTGSLTPEQEARALRFLADGVADEGTRAWALSELESRHSGAELTAGR